MPAIDQINEACLPADEAGWVLWRLQGGPVVVTAVPLGSDEHWLMAEKLLIRQSRAPVRPSVASYSLLPFIVACWLAFHARVRVRRVFVNTWSDILAGCMTNNSCRLCWAWNPNSLVLSYRSQSRKERHLLSSGRVSSTDLYDQMILRNL